MTPEAIREVLDRPYARELLTSAIPARMAYTARDGSPRAIPIGFLWNGRAFIICSPPRAPKVRALRADPRIALTIDNTAFPPHILLVRGTADIEIVNGVPDEYLLASRRYVGDEGMPQFEKQVRATYDQMATIAVTPNWVKLIDFETTLPSPVEEIMRRKQGGG